MENIGLLSEWCLTFRQTFQGTGHGIKTYFTHILPCTELFKMTVRVLTTCHTKYNRSPDTTPCDFFLWGYVKDQVYIPSLPASIPELKVQIRTATETITADMLQTVWNELDYRVDVCRITKGAHIEHL